MELDIAMKFSDDSVVVPHNTKIVDTDAKYMLTC